MSQSKSPRRDDRHKHRSQSRSSSYSRSQGSSLCLKRSRRSHSKDRQSPHRGRESSSCSSDRWSRSRSRSHSQRGTLGVQAVTPLQGGSHFIIISNPTHQNASAGSVHIHMTPGKDVNWIKSRAQFDRRWRRAQ